MLKNNIYLIILSIYALVLGVDIINLIKLIKRPTLNFNIDKYFFRLHLIVLFCGIILSLLLIVFEVNFLNYSKPIEYSNIKRITLDDFNGFKIPGQTHQGSNKFAFIETSIDFEKGNDFISVKAMFHPARSYVYIDDLQNDDLLRHELYHFRVTEIWAREFRKEITNSERMPTKNELLQFYNKISEQENSMQVKYDYDANHGYLLGKQIEWQNKIDSILYTLTPYKETYIRY